VRNLGGSLLQLVLFLALLGAVGQVGRNAGAEQGFLWMTALDRPDPTRVLALMCGVLGAGLVLEGRWRRRVSAGGRAALGLGSMLVGALLVLLTWNLSAAQDLYLVLSLAWVAAQGRVARIRVLGRPPAARALTLTLEQCAGREEAGRKAERLGALTAMGMPVPWGFAITTLGVDALTNPTRRGRLEREVRRAFRRLGVRHVAVRSSGLGEDGEQASFAGIYDSRLNVSEVELMEAIGSVAASLRSDLARSNGSGDARGGIVIQTMVPAQYSGVLFTEHPQDAGACLLEWTRGLGDDLVGGHINPEAVSFGRLSGQWREGEQPTEGAFEDLIEMGRRIEEHFGAPQDVEWALVQGQVSILQARDVTVRAGAEGSGDAHFERDRQKLVSALQGEPLDVVALVQDGISELIPNPTPFSARFLADMWLPGGTVDLACRSLGVRFRPREQGPQRVLFALGQVWTHVRVQREQDGGLSPWAGFQLSRCLPDLEQEVQVLVQRAERVAPLERALDLGRLSAQELVGLYTDRVRRFTTRSYVTAERVNVAAEWFMAGARKRLEAAGLNPAQHLVACGSTVSRAMEELDAVGRSETGRRAFLQIMGHRAVHDFEWSEARYGDDPRVLDGLLPGAVGGARAGNTGASPELKGILAATVARARRLQVLKEEAKHLALVELALARRAVYELGRRVGLERDDVWSLEPADIARLVRETDGVAVLPADLRIKVARAERLREALEGIDLPASLTPQQVEDLAREGLRFELPCATRSGLRGSRVAGAAEVVGRVRVCAQVADLKDFEPGEVLVTRFTDPSWSSVFGSAAGLVTEVGGWLSHAAILAREKNLPAVVGVAHAMRVLETGMWVRLGTDGQVAVLSDLSVAQGDRPMGRAVSGG
jgi:phosphohistidine swiveling domain-containing protein